MPETGHIELERRVDSIRVGARHRTDLGDLESLVKSIQWLGLLQPITIAPDGTLLCGRRRLEAVRRLEWRTVKVWVRSGLSDKLNMHLAEQHENMLHKPLALLEAAALYRELTQLLKEDAERRQHATRFGAAVDEEADGAAESAAPSRAGDTRRHAAEVVTGRASYTRLEQVNALDDVAADVAWPAPIRELAQSALDNIGEGAPVNPWFNEVANLKGRAAESASDDELKRLAEEALERFHQPKSRRPKPSGPSGRALRAFIHTWTDMEGWSAHYDPAHVGPALPEKEWARFERVLEETTAFHEAARTARAERREPVPA